MHHKSSYQAVILAAGMGTRLWPLTKSKPKALIKVNGKPIISYQINAYKNAGIEEDNIYVVTGYKGEKIVKYLSKKHSKVKIIENPIYDKTNNMYSLYLSLLNIEKKYVTLISNGDCIYHNEIIQRVVSNCNVNQIVCDSSFYDLESMKITISRGNIVSSISKKIHKDVASATSIDLYSISSEGIKKLKRIIENILDEDKNLWSEVAIDLLLQEYKLHPLDIKGLAWIEIDNKDDLIKAYTKFSNFKLTQSKTILCDLDGTVYLGNKPIKSAIDFINDTSEKYSYYFVTNNTSKSRNDYVIKLKDCGIRNVDIENILTPTKPMAKYLLRNDYHPIFCVGTNSLINELRELGIKIINSGSSDIINSNYIKSVVVGYDTELSYEKIKTASILLQDKTIRYFATHPDKICPTEYGPVPDVGSIVELLGNATKRKPEKIFGKPFPDILDDVLYKYNKKELVFIGDRLNTDFELAKNVSIDFILVLSGDTSILEIEDSNSNPTLIVKDFGHIKLKESQ